MSWVAPVSGLGAFFIGVSMVKLLKSSLKTAPVTRAKRQQAESSPRPRGRKWMETRERIMRRDNGLCCECRRNGNLAYATDVDHIIPRWEGGSDDDSNLQALCDACHKAKTTAEAARRASGGAVW